MTEEEKAHIVREYQKGLIKWYFTGRPKVTRDKNGKILDVEVRHNV